MIGERLEEQAADKARISVTPEEVDRGIQKVASEAKVTVKELMAEVRREGLTEQDYRNEIRRQLLEGKLVELRVLPRVRVTEQDARAAYQHYMREPSQARALPPFEEVRDEMMQRALLEALKRQTDLWLQELRRGVYIDVRL